MSRKTVPFAAPVVVATLALALGAAGPRDLANLGPTIVISTGAQAKLCATHARMVADGMMSPAQAVATCTSALETEGLTTYDQAATHNNRGIVLMDMLGGLPQAQADFAEAETLAPDLGETYVNQGAALLRQDQYAAALAQLDKAFAFELKEPWRAHYNRGIAREQLGDVRGAYQDFTRARELKPDWEAPAVELSRYQVRRKAP